MTYFISTFDVSIISLILLSIILISARIKKDYYSFSSKLLKIIVVLTIIGSTIEPITWFVEDKPGLFYYHLGFITNSLEILFGTIVSAIWISYWDYKLNQSKKKVIQRNFYLYPVLVQLILLIYNRFTGAFFSIDSQTNTFSETPIYFILYLIYLMYFIYLISLIVRSSSNKNYKMIHASLIFMIFPALSVSIQLFIPELIFSWPSLAISVLLVYIFLETSSGNKDILTNLYSRRPLELYLQSLIENKTAFSAIMIDLDCFKEINDIYGHTIGDQVLIKFAGLLTNTYSNKDIFVARLGGDEFFVIIEDNKNMNSHEFVADIKEKWINDDFFLKFPFLNFSAGIISSQDNLTLDDVLNLSDRQMYLEKENKRNQ